MIKSAPVKLHSPFSSFPFSKRKLNLNYNIQQTDYLEESAADWSDDLFDQKFQIFTFLIPAQIFLYRGVLQVELINWLHALNDF